MDSEESNLGYTEAAIERLKRQSHQYWIHYVHLLRDGDDKAANEAYEMMQKLDAQRSCLEATLARDDDVN
jgi:hypothetical protein